MPLFNQMKETSLTIVMSNIDLLMLKLPVVMAIIIYIYIYIGTIYPQDDRLFLPQKLCVGSRPRETRSVSVAGDC